MELRIPDSPAVDCSDSLKIRHMYLCSDCVIPQFPTVYLIMLDEPLIMQHNDWFVEHNDWFVEHNEWFVQDEPLIMLIMLNELLIMLMYLPLSG